MTLLVYYNPNQYHFYIKLLTLPIDYYVGFENSYGHFIVQVLVVRNGIVYSVDKPLDVVKYHRKNDSIKIRFIKRLIRFLNKLVG